MTTITVPKELRKKKNLVVLPREVYEEFLVWQKTIKSKETFKPTMAQKKDLIRARKNYSAHKTITLKQLKNELGIIN